jgi:putative ATP-dependent endonuclease of the OLD family
MFFARRVVFVEGATEKAVLPFLAHRWSIDLGDVSFVDCGGKGNLPTYIALARSFGLSFAVLFDEDAPLPSSAPSSSFLDNPKIEAQILDGLGAGWMMCPDFERWLGVHGVASGKPHVAIEHFESLTKEKLDELSSIRSVLERIKAVQPFDGTTTRLSANP